VTHDAGTFANATAFCGTCALLDRPYVWRTVTERQVRSCLARNATHVWKASWIGDSHHRRPRSGLP
jgi:hypothetical protein